MVLLAAQRNPSHLLPLMLGLRREDEGSGGCGGRTTDPRALTLHTTAASGASIGVSNLNRHTRDIPVLFAQQQTTLSADRIEYWGDESAALYGFEFRRVGDVRGQRYFGWTQLFGQFAAAGSPPDRIDTARFGIPAGVEILRHYDRGLCSQFTRRSDFGKQFIRQLDEAIAPQLQANLPFPCVRNGPASGVGNMALTPLLRIEPDGKIYEGANRDTGDQFLISRTYSTGATLCAGFITLKLTGRFRSNDRGLPTYEAANVEALYGPDNLLSPATQATLLASITTQFSSVLEEQVWQRVPVISSRSLACNPATGEIANVGTCQSVVVNTFSALAPTLQFPTANVRCRRRPTDPGTVLGRCEIRPNVLRAQSYPEGFEFVLVDDPTDLSAVLLRNDPNQAQALCAGTRPPMATGRRSGVVDSVFVSVGQ
ncbi:MAG: hypothetical protein Q8Q09_22020 [Deltaproteobacteria bacterium]|nr:hypothetical protein [Deltaproteobacteria bacterium]